MKIIERKTYLESLQNVRLTPDIKVVTGVRRAGKFAAATAIFNIIYRPIHDVKLVRWLQQREKVVTY